MGGGRGARKQVGMREPANFGCKHDVLSRLRCSGFDLGETEAQHVSFACTIPRAGREFCQRCLDIKILAIDVSIRRERMRNVISAEPVDCIALSRRRAKSQLIGLPVYRDQFIGQLGEGADRHRASTDLCARTPVSADDATQQQRVVVEVAAQLVDHLHYVPGGHPQSPVDGRAS